MSDDDYSSEDHIEVVDQRPSTEREVHTEERERVTFLAEDRLDPEDRQELESRALEGAEQAELYEESWTPAHDADLDEIHDYIDHRLDRDREEDTGSARARSTTSDVPLRPEEAERLRRAVPGDVLDREVRYRTDSGSVVRVRYRAKDGDVQTTVLSIGPDRVRFLDDIQTEVDEQGIDIADLDLKPPEPPAGEPGRSRRRTEPEPEPGAETEPEPEAEATETADSSEASAAEAEQALEEAVEEPDEPDESEQRFSEEDLELAEELGIPPEELADITEEEEESGGIGDKLPFGKGGDEDEDEADEDEASSGGIGGKLPFGKKAKGGEEPDEPDEAEDAEAGSGGFKDKLPFGKKAKEADDAEDEDADDADDDDEGSGGVKDKLPFG